MAAVLCKSIGECCALPFKCCAASCKGCNEACGGACKGCGQAFEQCFKLLCRNPFSLFVAVALFCQGPAVFLVIPAIGGIPDCPESLYLVANSLLAAVNVFTAFYLAYRIVDTSNPEMGDTAFKRALYLLCNDPWFAMYICLFIGFMCVQAWGSTMGFGNFFQDDIPADDQICPEATSSMLSIGTSLGWAFCFLGFGALLFSLCCAKFDNATYGQPANNNTTNPSVPHGSNEYNAQGVPNNDIPQPMPPPGSATYNSQGVPNNDYPQQSGKKDTRPASSSTASPMYTQQGIPTNDFPNGAPPQQEEIPMAYAHEIPQGSAPPSSYDTTGSNAGANTANNNNNNAASQPNTGGKVGGTAGKQIGKLFSSDQAKQEKMAQQGQKAGEAVQSGLAAGMNFLKSKMNNKNNKNNDVSA